MTGKVREMLMSEFVPANDRKVVRVCELMGYDCSSGFPSAQFDRVVAVRGVRAMLRRYSVTTAEDYIWRLVRYLKQVLNFRRLEEYCELLEVYRWYSRTGLCDGR
jgi:hypothetical protein